MGAQWVKGTCSQAQRAIVKPQDSHSRRSELVLTSCPLTSTCMLRHTPTQNHKINNRNIILKDLNNKAFKGDAVAGMIAMGWVAMRLLLDCGEQNA